VCHHNIDGEGIVEERTAKALNGLLRDLGVLDTKPETDAFIMRGRVAETKQFRRRAA
jgi:hypothetical protein